ncbi:hypothetical protein B2G71_17740 [Novosphingobium sp. PC22D]|uniref:3-isopropylmalate dehydratase small subunit n=1 Tax=Novosphingobium sp. PC22D TaxID=1962403 RepID=UPI000BEF4528|nr:3-isopropylmalate dehydratase small subunit [Novosphingobium sp. PC22D]PEQ11394.1 hypothetical protein B2G71_17740 [Novosphingobium sp. PC22D]
MTAVRTVSGKAVSLPLDDIDTDVIFPARYLLHTEKKGLGRFAFHDRPEIVAAFEAAGHPQILVAGANFGCGSSREHAVWALAGLGLRAVIAPSFGEIFRGNCANNAVIAAAVDARHIGGLHAAAAAGGEIAVDLEAQEVRADTLAVPFAIPAGDREMLLEGWNTTTRLLALHGEAIAHFENRQRAERPWLWNKDETTP